MPDRKIGRPARLNRERVIQAALDLADARGIESLTMRNIGRQVGAEAMSLYRHVANKEDVLDGIVDLVYREIEVPPSAVGWSEAMRRRAISTREALLRHPWAIALMESRMRPGPANMRHHDAVLGILFAAGFSSRDATHAYNLLDSYVYGFAIQEEMLPISSELSLAEVGEPMIQLAAADEYSNLHAVGVELLATGFRYADEFEFGLDLVLDALERWKERASTPDPAAVKTH